MGASRRREGGRGKICNNFVENLGRSAENRADPLDSCRGINNSGGRLLGSERATSCERGGRGIRVSEVKRALVHRSKNAGTERPSLFAADPS